MNKHVRAITSNRLPAKAASGSGGSLSVEATIGIIAAVFGVTFIPVIVQEAKEKTVLA